MTMRPAASRLVTLATLAALAASIVGTTAADARSGSHAADRSIRIGQDPGREQSGVRSYRHVDVAKLPASTGKASPVNRPSPRRRTASTPRRRSASPPRPGRRSRPRTPTRRSPRRRPSPGWPSRPATVHLRRAARPVGGRRAGARGSGRQHGVPHSTTVRAPRSRPPTCSTSSVSARSTTRARSPSSTRT